MNIKTPSSNKVFWLLGMLLMALLVIVALAPQIDLWSVRGADWNGTYALNELDEPTYASYLQSIIDGKPRLNSPYTGAVDSPSTPQTESTYSIEFLSTYPLAITARVLGLDSSGAMILLSIIGGALSAFAVYWLIYLLSQNATIAFVGTMFVLFLGALFAGHGIIMALIAPDSMHYGFSLMFLRRTRPLTSFPALFFFFGCVWKYLNAVSPRAKIFFIFASTFCFAFTVYAYFFHWTTVFAWFFGLMMLWVICRFNDFRQNIFYHAALLGSLFLSLVPYYFLLANRSHDMDSGQLLVNTHQPDLFRIPEVISFAVILLLLFLYLKNQINLRETKYIFLLSLALVSPMVFNQQIITGHVLQPFHYETFSTNYIMAVVVFTLTFNYLEKFLSKQNLYNVLLSVGAFALIICYLDTTLCIDTMRVSNLYRDKFAAVTNKIKEVRKTESIGLPTKGVVLSSELNHPLNYFFVFSDIPSLSSTPVLWSQHLIMSPEISPHENKLRLYRAMYYENLDEEWLKSKLVGKSGLIVPAVFGWDRVSEVLTLNYRPVTNAEITAAVEEYKKFRANFNSTEAKSPELSFVILNQKFENDLSALDNWYDRNQGEIIGDYVLYRVKLRKP